jgi:predicted nuclease of restriction endonuclease-like (RecB) superfamily
MNFDALVKQIQSVQSTLQASAAHAINIGVTVRNWLIGCYIVEFEQNGEDRAKYGEKLLKNLETRLNTKGMTERRFREYRRLYTVYPQIGDEIANLFPADTVKQLSVGIDVAIRRSLTAELQPESETPIRRSLTAELESESETPIRRLATAELEPESETPIRRLATAELESKSETSIRRSLSAELESESESESESETSIRHSPSAEFQIIENDDNTWMSPASFLLSKLSYTHLENIMTIENPVKRAFYELECVKGSWSVSELERQINTLYYERSGLSKNKKALSALVNRQAIQLQPKDIINTPIALEFLNLNERALVTENDLEEAILDNLQAFLLEMGRGFCFEARQKRILIDNDYFFVDLLFYHRILKCHVIVELKVDKFRHEYASQLNMYLNYFKHEEITPDDNPPVGILLCTEKGKTQVKYATAGLDENIFVQKYLVELPNEKMLKEYISNEFRSYSSHITHN